MYKILTLIIITSLVGIIVFFMYPPYANHGKEFTLNKSLTDLPEMGTTLNEFKRLSSSENSLNNRFKVAYKPTCEIELYNKFATNIKTKKQMEKYLRSVSRANTPSEVILFQNELFSKTKFTDTIFNDVLNTNLRLNKTFLHKINKRSFCSENQ